jgi:hypothetical protein
MKLKRFLMGMAAGILLVLGCWIGCEIGLMLIVFAFALASVAIW